MWKPMTFQDGFLKNKGNKGRDTLGRAFGIVIRNAVKNPSQMVSMLPFGNHVRTY